jgi:gas vesicle protein
MMHRAAETVVDTSSSAYRMTKEAVGLGKHPEASSISTDTRSDTAKTTSESATQHADDTLPKTEALEEKTEKSKPE